MVRTNVFPTKRIFRNKYNLYYGLNIPITVFVIHLSSEGRFIHELLVITGKNEFYIFVCKDKYSQKQIFSREALTC